MSYILPESQEKRNLVQYLSDKVKENYEEEANSDNRTERDHYWGKYLAYSDILEKITGEKDNNS